MAARRRPDGWWYPWTFVVGMLLVVAVNVVLIAYAIGTFPGLRTENAYGKGLKYNETLAAVEAQERLGWRSDITLTPLTSDAGARRVVVSAVLLDREGRPLTGLAARALITRPTVKGHDIGTPLVEQADGRYGAEVTLPLPGVWDIRVHAHRGADNFQGVRRISVP